MDRHHPSRYRHLVLQIAVVALLFITGCAQDTVDVTIWENSGGVDTVQIAFQEGLGEEVVLTSDTKDRIVKKITHALETIDTNYEHLPLSEEPVPDPGFRFSIKKNGSETKLTFSQGYEIKTRQGADYVKQYLEALKKKLEEYQL